MKINSFLVTGLLFSPAGMVEAQSSWTVFNASNSPLPDNSVRCITTAPDGKVWVGTDFGLASYDGQQWNVFQTSNSGIAGNDIRSIASDSSGNLWIGTFNNGVCRYDGVAWINFNSSNSPLPDNYVRTLMIDAQNRKWFGTIGGLACYNDSIWEIYNISNSVIGSNNISALFSDSVTGDMAIGTVNGGWTLISGGVWNHFMLSNSNLPDNTILGITKDTSGTWWLSTPAAGVTAYIGGVMFFTQTTLSSNIQSNSTTCITTFPANDVKYIGSTDAGLIRKDGNNFTSINMAISGWPDDYVRCVVADPSGWIWVGTQSGGLVKMEETVPVQEINGLNTSIFNIFPNPVKEQLTINCTDGNGSEVLIYDSNGRMVMQEFIGSGSPVTSVNVAYLNAGFYILVLRSTNGNFKSAAFIRSDP